MSTWGGTQAGSQALGLGSRALTLVLALLLIDTHPLGWSLPFSVFLVLLSRTGCEVLLLKGTWGVGYRWGLWILSMGTGHRHRCCGVHRGQYLWIELFPRT